MRVAWNTPDRTNAFLYLSTLTLTLVFPLSLSSSHFGFSSHVATQVEDDDVDASKIGTVPVPEAELDRTPSLTAS